MDDIYQRYHLYDNADFEFVQKHFLRRKWWGTLVTRANGRLIFSLPCSLNEAIKQQEIVPIVIFSKDVKRGSLSQNLSVLSPATSIPLLTMMLTYMPMAIFFFLWAAIVTAQDAEMFADVRINYGPNTLAHGLPFQNAFGQFRGCIRATSKVSGQTATVGRAVVPAICTQY
ncbi:hypothetical protein BCR42DRAFT_397263 [Absidia repens]|uniref:Uncharacterized protein n=1 Tax=Absidia repens TaxID=90262 RepID=A0A1X2I1L4_9FUNG|nr:hypothetical protein BCR42DRAFT_397263 [Absidia repens]